MKIASNFQGLNKFKPIVNKKGIFFTFAAIALAVMLIFSSKVYNDYKLKDEMEVVEIRVDTMNNFIKDLENDMQNAIFISGFRSLLSLEDYIMTHGKFLNDPVEPATPSLDVAFNDAFLYGIVGGEKTPLMENNTFSNWTQRMKVQANEMDIGLEFSVNSVAISQSEPWMVDVEVNLNINVEDEKNAVLWTINNKDYTKKINITSEIGGLTKFVDPLYLVKNDGKVNNTIRKTTVDPSSSTANLNTHLINSYYIEHSDAPSYLYRFEKNMLASPSACCGVESLVNTQELIDEGVSTYDRSAVDYIYYGTQITSNCKIIGLEAYDWFKLDLNHLGFYGASCIP